MAYFTYDSIIEIYYGTDDLLTNMHHVIVVFSTCFFFFNKYGGFEYIGKILNSNFTVLHLIAEISNPFLILRTLLKIVGMKDSKLYEINDIIFATVFLFVRMLLTPLAMIYMYEGKNVLTAAKIGTQFVLFIQLFWCYRVLFLIAEKAKNSYNTKGGDSNEPLWVKIFYELFRGITQDKKTRMIVTFINFIWIVVCPFVYYRNTMFNNY